MVSIPKLGETRVREIRVRGGGIKLRALRLDSGIFAWSSEGISRKTRLIAVVYNGANNEFVRTNTLVKNEIVQIDAAPFRLWYETHYGVTIGRKKVTKKETAAAAATAAAPAAVAPVEAAGTAAAAKKKVAVKAAGAVVKADEKKKSKKTLFKFHKRAAVRALDTTFEDQFATGRILACITSRPGQTGRIDGYLLEGKELEFYLKKTQKKKSKSN